MAFYGDGKRGELQFYEMYPVTIILDRYQGTYSGGTFTAWGCHPEHVPDDIYSDDDTCHYFWHHEIESFKYDYGVGNTIQDALDDLYYKSKNPMIKDTKKDVWWTRDYLEKLVENHEDHIGPYGSLLTSFQAADLIDKYEADKEAHRIKKEKESFIEKEIEC